MKTLWMSIVLGLGLLGIACPSDSCDNSAGPSPIVAPGPTTNGDDIEPAIEMRQDTEPDFYQVVGYSGFALAMRDESFMHSYINHGIGHGYNTIRVLGKTDGWGRTKHPEWLPPGPSMGGGAEENLKRMLKVAAQYPNFWLEIVACATERDNHKECLAWARQVAKITRGYKNVFINAMNEPQQSNWTNGELNELMQVLRASGRPVGVDQPCEPQHWRFPSDLIVDWKGMHPWRNPYPKYPEVHTLTPAELRNVVRLNGLVMFNETSSYVSDWEADRWNLRNHDNFYLRGNGTEEERKQAAIDDKNLYKHVRNAQWYAHSVAGIESARLPWLPRY
jgi:hypothetical protein